ncbi:MAG: glycosyltransferase [Bacteroidales bacterium]|nr:glycosyltransferase [Bacteroidales bacterium]
MKLSIIIPVYNVEAYVGKTLESVFATDASADDFEVIVVNDGTEDGSMDVVRRYADRPNISIIEQENQGLSAARTKGFSIAKGEFIWFVDSDDWLVEDGVGRVLALLEERPGADVLMFPIVWNYEDTTKNHQDYHFDSEKVVCGKEVIRDMGLRPWAVSRLVWKRSLADNKWLYFPLGLLHEDAFFGTVIACIAEVVHLMPEAVYVYRSGRPGSIVNSITVRSSYDCVSIHKHLMRFMEAVLDPSEWGWFRVYCWERLQRNYTWLPSLYGKRGYDCFAFSNGLYVWRQWNKVYPGSSLHKKMGRLFFFLMPRIRTRLIG